MSTPQPEAWAWKFSPFNENLLKTFLDNTLWFSKPEHFNDPFDCQFDIFAVYDEYKEDILKSVIENSPDAFCNDQALESLLDTSKKNLHKETNQSFEAFDSKIVLLCLCKEINQTLMWSHYADNHNGLALGFSEGFLSEKGYLWADVCYNPNNFKTKMVDVFIDLFLDLAIHAANSFSEQYLDRSEDEVHNIQQKLMEVIYLKLTTKADCWSYEKEIRFISQIANSAPGMARHFKPSHLTNVAFGLNCSQMVKKAVFTLLQGSKWSHITYWQAEKDLSTMTVKFKHLSDTEIQEAQQSPE